MAPWLVSRRAVCFARSRRLASSTQPTCHFALSRPARLSLPFQDCEEAAHSRYPISSERHVADRGRARHRRPRGTAPASDTSTVPSHSQRDPGALGHRRPMSRGPANGGYRVELRCLFTKAGMTGFGAMSPFAQASLNDRSPPDLAVPCSCWQGLLRGQIRSIACPAQGLRRRRNSHRGQLEPTRANELTLSLPS